MLRPSHTLFRADFTRLLVAGATPSSVDRTQLEAGWCRRNSVHHIPSAFHTARNFSEEFVWRYEIGTSEIERPDHDNTAALSRTKSNDRP
jgi:hypothetical protein